MDGESIPAPGVVVQLSEQPRHYNGHCSQWTEERRAILKTLWADGKSGRQIAERLGGVTRNAVIGMVHRMGLPGRATTRVHAKKTNGGGWRLKFKLREVTRALRMTTAPLPPPAIDDIPRKTILDLEDNECRFPTGEPNGTHHFCALQRLMGSPYCEAHHFRAFNGVE